MIQHLSITDFLQAAAHTSVIDVRTPAEHQQGHILGSSNIPLFTNEERVLVGTAYKQQGRQPAILLGFELVGGRWAACIREAEKLSRDNQVLVHCWRGGMRSGAMAWALNLYGFDVGVLEGGYKAYRQHCRAAFEKTYPFVVLGGKTGSAKTETLLEMKRLGEQVIDLEGLAQHQGSSFGSMNRMMQPSQEHFENRLANELLALDTNKRIWVEDESLMIGQRCIPDPIFKQMRQSNLVNLLVPIEKRIAFLESVYGILDKDFLISSVLKIAKRLGPVETQKTVQAIKEGRMTDFIRQVLYYYDKTYQHGQSHRNPSTMHQINQGKIDPTANAKAIINLSDATFSRQYVRQ